MKGEGRDHYREKKKGGGEGVIEMVVAPVAEIKPTIEVRSRLRCTCTLFAAPLTVPVPLIPVVLHSPRSPAFVW